MEQLPITSSVQIAASLAVGRRSAATDAVPTPRLEPAPLPLGRTLELVIGVRAASSSIGLHQLVVAGPLVTYGALREGFWAQRRSIGLWVRRVTTDSDRLAQALGEVWGLAPAALEGELFGGRREVARPDAGGAVAAVARSLFSLESFLGQDVFFYTRRGTRLLSSRLRIDGHLSFGPGTLDWLAEDVPEVHAPLVTARGKNVGLELHGPGREYDL
jgi:hypothetical protein